MRDGIAGLSRGTRPEARDGAVEVALGLQGVAEGKMAGGATGVEPDRGTEALDGLVQAAEPPEDGAEIAVKVCPRRIARDRLLQQIDGDGWPTGRCCDAG